MSDRFADMAAALTDDKLIDVLAHERTEYTAPALAAIEAEATRRGITQEQVGTVQSAATVKSYGREEFSPLDHAWSHADIALATAILKDNQIPFYIDNPTSSDIMPTEGLASVQFRVHVHNDHLARARELLDEHYTADGGVYALKDMPVKDRLKLLNFNEFGIDAKTAHEVVDVQFSPQERAALAVLAKRLLGEVETIEAEQGRAVFYYDNLQELSDRLSATDAQKWHVIELVALLEVVQIYCDDPAFPQGMDDTINGLLDFFKSLASS